MVGIRMSIACGTTHVVSGMSRVVHVPYALYPASATPRRPDPPIGLALTLPALPAVRVRLLGLR
jgi:hypothetical protein